MRIYNSLTPRAVRTCNRLLLPMISYRTCRTDYNCNEGSRGESRVCGIDRGVNWPSENGGVGGGQASHRGSTGQCRGNGRRGSGKRAVVLAVCCSALFMVGLDNTIVNVGLPAIGQIPAHGVAGLQWTVAGYTIVLASLLMFSGAAADRIGRRTIFQVGLSLFTLGSWLCSLAPSLCWLIAFRMLQGVGGSMLNPSALGIITNTFSRPGERAKAIGVWDGVFGLSMALGPVLGGILIGSVGWRGIFWANIPVGLAAISLTALFVPDSRAPKARKADPVGQFLVIVMLGSLAYAIIQGPEYGWASPKIIALLRAVGGGARRPARLRAAPRRAADRLPACSAASRSPAPTWSPSARSRRPPGFLFLTSCTCRTCAATARCAPA